MKNITLSVLLAISTTAALPAIAQTSTLNTPDTVALAVNEQQYSDADLDSILAPIALYPDTLLTHILIAATYPLDVIAADRWRQSNQHLTPEQVENVLESVSWDPSVKALAPFTDLLNTMAQDLVWLQQLGDNVLISQERVLDRVQVLRQHAHNTGNLVTNDYIEVETERERNREIIYIEPRQREVVYVPYYNPHVVYGHWWHSNTPIYWSHRVSYHHHHNVYWSPRIRLSTFFYFGGVHWHNRHVVIHREPVRRYYHGSPRKRVVSTGYQRWEHRSDHRRARYSSQVVQSAPTRFESKGVVRNHKQSFAEMKHNAKNVSLRTDRGINTTKTIPPKTVTPLREYKANTVKNHQQPTVKRKEPIEHALKRNQSVASTKRTTSEQTLKRLKHDKVMTSKPVTTPSQRIEHAYNKPDYKQKYNKPTSIKTERSDVRSNRSVTERTKAVQPSPQNKLYKSEKPVRLPSQSSSKSYSKPEASSKASVNMKREHNPVKSQRSVSRNEKSISQTRLSRE